MEWGNMGRCHLGEKLLNERKTKKNEEWGKMMKN
jgi:hypothetical protein